MGLRFPWTRPGKRGGLVTRLVIDNQLEGQEHSCVQEKLQEESTS